MDSSETILERPISSVTLKPHFGESHPSNMTIRNFRHVGYIRQIPSYVMDFPVLFNNPPGWTQSLRRFVPGHLRSGSAARRKHPRSHPKSVRESSGFVHFLYVFMCWFYDLYSGMSKKLEFPEWSASQPTS